MKSIAQQMWPPRLRKLEVENAALALGFRVSWLPNGRFHSSSINDPRFLRSMDCIDGNFVGMLLFTVKELNAFAWEADHPCPGHEGHNLRTAMECMACGLQAHNESLKELFIATSGPASIWDLGYLPSLANFTNLTSLAVPESQLVE